ncbi:MBL fold metallo-hydrolase [Candidatus Woesearchaeota archaeon]|nr:MBL fold metallo-hydrolase [Candidatus Woesearchaeota archaeon]
MKVLDFNGIKVKWLGHDSFKFEFNGLVMYIDPFQVKETEKADIILITHGHYDHCSVEDLKRLVRQDTLIVTTPDTTSKLSGKVEGGNVKLVKPEESFVYKDIKITTVHAYNINKQFHPRQNDWVGYVFTINNIIFYHAGDTDFIPEMGEIRADVAFLPVSGTYVMNPEEAMHAARKIMPKVAIPMHYGKIIGEKADAEKFKELCTFCQVKLMD